MKNLVLSLALGSLLGLGAAFAAQAPAGSADQAPAAQAPAAPEGGQRPHHRQVDPDRQIQHLAKKLNLSSDQQNQIKPILSDRQQQIAAIVNDKSLSREDRHSKMLAVREDSKNKIESVLNADQKQTYEQMLQRQHQHRKTAAQS